jgi:chorismate-pyruvate lyase
MKTAHLRLLTRVGSTDQGRTTPLLGRNLGNVSTLKEMLHERFDYNPEICLLPMTCQYYCRFIYIIYAHQIVFISRIQISTVFNLAL